jgi:hypothetical protein
MMDHTDAATAAHSVKPWQCSDLMIVIQIINRAMDAKKRDLDSEPFLFEHAKKGYALDSLKEYLNAFGISKKDLVKKYRPRDEYD